MKFQPCDWVELDSNFKYVVDAFGRTDSGDIARVRITGFCPYFYVKVSPNDTAKELRIRFQAEQSKKSGKPANFGNVKITEETKLDAMTGFSGLVPIKVWKIECPALWIYKSISRIAKDLKLVIYESNLPPLLRLFHELDINPASPFEFDGEQIEVGEDVNVDVEYTVQYKEIKPFTNISIPLYVCSYDLEVYSESGMFPVASNASDEIIQIGLSFRWSDMMLTSEERFVFLIGECTPSADPTVKFISCKDERDLLIKFEKCIRDENPDILCGYNTFGFDDAYIADRAEFHRLTLNFGRVEVNQWGDSRERVKTEKKTFELASGKFAVRYIQMPGRMTIDLLLSIRREQNLDSYKLDNVASTFLRDKVSNIVIISGGKTRQFEIHTKNTRGLFVGNLVRFDIVGNTINPYADGMKFKVVEVFPKKFIVELEEHNSMCTFEDIDMKNLEWCFGKDDVTAKDIFASHHGTPDQRALIAKYCVQDCDLVLTVMAKLDTLINARGMADVCRVPITYIFLRGQGIKIYSAVVYNASKRNQIILTQEGFEGDTSYEGAIVLPPKIGMYLDQPISVLDFNSLYPSNMIAFNLSPDTLVYVKEFNINGKKIRQEGTDGEEFRNNGYKIDEISYDVHNDEGESTGRITCGFVQPTSDPKTIGLLPLTLDILLKKRKETRKIMEKTEDEAQKAVLNGLQLAYKVVANSVYGQAGSKTSPIRKIEVAACTTAVGRSKIYEAKTIVESEFGATVIYGDSVASYTPVIIRQDGIIKIIQIDEITNNWQTYGDKECAEINNIESWTETGWTRLERVIRHKLAPHKKMIRVLTHTGLVDVTDDHSLLNSDNIEVSPKNLKIGDNLLHTAFPSVSITETTDITKARIAGFFVGDGSCGFYNCPSGDKSSWALNNSNINLLIEYLERCQTVYPEFDWVINNTLVSSNVYKLVPKSKKYGDLKNFIVDYRDMYYTDNRKNIPDWIMNGSLEIRQSFWDGFYDADGDKDMNGYVRIDQKHQTTTAQLAFIASSIGFNISINTRKDKPNIFRITCTKNSHRKNSSAIKKMHEIVYDGYVYDLTTSNHHFQAGIGKMIVHNTDSIFIQFPTKDLAESIELGKSAAEKITSLCRRPHKIEYEKTLYPFILFCRKRYVGMKYEDDVHKCKRMTMGVALKRRDNAPIVKDVFGGALDILMEHRDIRKAQEFVKNMLVDILQNKIPLEKFIITKQLRDDYKNPGQIAHRVLADRMEERDAGNKPQVGDRLAYVYIKEKRDAKKQGERIEQIDYVKEKNLAPDTEFYITNQVQKPVAQLFALAIEQLDGYRPKNNYKQWMTEYMETMTEEESTLKILDYKEKELNDILFMGAQYLKKHKRGPLDMFITRH
jgi:DNA polymerase elongation subunit (family B)